MTNENFLKKAIEESHKSFERGRFPAGAVVVLNNKVIASEMSDVYPGYQHAECRAIDLAFQKVGILSDAILYTSMEPCLMCLMRAYWAGIRKFFYAISRKSLSYKYYEGSRDNEDITKNLNEKIEYLQLVNLESEALKIVKDWEGK